MDIREEIIDTLIKIYVNNQRLCKGTIGIGYRDAKPNEKPSDYNVPMIAFNHRGHHYTATFMCYIISGKLHYKMELTKDYKPYSAIHLQRLINEISEDI